MASTSSSRKPSPYGWMKAIPITRTKPHKASYRPDLPLRAQVRQVGRSSRVSVPRSFFKSTKAEQAAYVRVWEQAEPRRALRPTV